MSTRGIVQPDGPPCSCPGKIEFLGPMEIKNSIKLLTIPKIFKNFASILIFVFSILQIWSGGSSTRLVNRRRPWVQFARSWENEKEREREMPSQNAAETNRKPQSILDQLPGGFRDMELEFQRLFGEVVKPENILVSSHIDRQISGKCLRFKRLFSFRRVQFPSLLYLRYLRRRTRHRLLCICGCTPARLSILSQVP